MSKSPYRISANVLGIGVAVITSTSGLTPFPTMLALCLTPNLCCSSVTTSPKFLNSTSSTNNACVPTNISISPFFNFSKTSVLFLALIPPSNSSHFIPNFSNILLKFFICCSASIAVGAIIAVWYPHFAALYADIIDTIVLPEPTSPCNSLFIGLLLSISLSISSNTLNCAFVSLNGSEFITSDIFTFLSNSIPSISLSYLDFKLDNASCTVSSSSNTNLLLALLYSVKLSGKCICFVALFISSKLYSFNIYSGIVSSSFPKATFSPFSIMLRNLFCDRLNVSGYIGIIFPVFLLSPSLSKTGLVISILPYLMFTLP